MIVRWIPEPSSTVGAIDQETAAKGVSMGFLFVALLGVGIAGFVAGIAVGAEEGRR